MEIEKGFLIVDGKHGIDAVYKKPSSISTMPLFNIHRSVIIIGMSIIVIVVHPLFVLWFQKSGGPLCGD